LHELNELNELNERRDKTAHKRRVPGCLRILSDINVDDTRGEPGVYSSLTHSARVDLVRKLDPNLR